MKRVKVTIKYISGVEEEYLMSEQDSYSLEFSLQQRNALFIFHALGGPKITIALDKIISINTVADELKK